jgi:hypothetical protein
MPIELIIKIGIGVLFGGLICVSVLSLIHRRAIRLTERRLESAFEHSTAQVRADKELLQTILAHARAQMVELDRKESAINRLSSELDALKIEFVSLKTKFESTYSAPLNEHASLVPVSPSTSQVTLEETWARGNSEGQSIQEDTGSRGNDGDTGSRVEPESDTSIVPTISQSDPGDTWTREVDLYSPSRLTAALASGNSKEGH